MKYLVATSVVVLLSVSFSPDMLIAQAENVFKRTYEGEVVQASDSCTAAYLIGLKPLSAEAGLSPMR